MHECINANAALQLCAAAQVVDYHKHAQTSQTIELTPLTGAEGASFTHERGPKRWHCKGACTEHAVHT